MANMHPNEIYTEKQGICLNIKAKQRFDIYLGGRSCLMGFWFAIDNFQWHRLWSGRDDFMMSVEQTFRRLQSNWSKIIWRNHFGFPAHPLLECLSRTPDTISCMTSAFFSLRRKFKFCDNSILTWHESKNQSEGKTFPQQVAAEKKFWTLLKLRPSTKPRRHKLWFNVRVSTAQYSCLACQYPKMRVLISIITFSTNSFPSPGRVERMERRGEPHMCIICS